MAGRGPFPSSINLTCGRRSERLHHDPACGGQAQGGETLLGQRREHAIGVSGSPTWIRQD
jgi:hypothetical protein